MYFVLTKTVEMLHKTSLTGFIFASLYTHILPTLFTLTLLMSEEGLKEKELRITLTFPFPP